MAEWACNVSWLSLTSFPRDMSVREAPDFIGAPEEIRTPDPQIRSLVLYPAELRARLAHRAGNVPEPSKAAGNAPLAIGFGQQWQVRQAQKDAPTRLHVRVRDGVQRVSGAPLIRDRHGPKRSRVCSASLRAALRPGHAYLN